MNEVGDLRPSQLIFTYGVGALVDLPRMSALIMGLDDWKSHDCTEITEERLLTALQKRMGKQVSQLLLPPTDDDASSRDQAVLAKGVPVAPFPRWLRCTACDMLAKVDSGVFKLKQDNWSPDQTRYIHEGCSRAHGASPDAMPVRYLIACRDGHLTDFPWIEFVHYGGQACTPSILTLREYGAAGDATDIIVKCRTCGKDRRVADSFDTDKFKITCSGHHPHLRKVDKSCSEEARTILLGASNNWFPILLSVLSIPEHVDRLTQLITEYWDALKDIDGLEVAKYVTAPKRMPAFAEYKPEQIWDAIEAKRKGQSEEKEVQQEENLKLPEWKALSDESLTQVQPDFSIRFVDPPAGYENYFERTCLVDRLREVRALMGFTRIESNGDFVDAEYTPDRRITPLSRQPPEWLPVSEVRGEGIFIRFREEAMRMWEALPKVQEMEKAFLQGHIKWRFMRKIEPADANFPGMRLVFLHSLAHALMRQISLECGYTAASLRERIYCQLSDSPDGPMAGFLIYTSASDSDGTLGGLVALGESKTLGRHLQQALESMRICSSDPLCSEHKVSADGRGIHGACCHACLFVSETSCECGNRYLDRAVLDELRDSEFAKNLPPPAPKATSNESDQPAWAPFDPARGIIRGNTYKLRNGDIVVLDPDGTRRDTDQTVSLSDIESYKLK